MSIYDELGARVNEDRLFFVEPPDLPGSILARKLYISPIIQGLLSGPWDSVEWQDRCIELEADFHRFVTGAMIAVRLPPSKSIEAYIAQLEPPQENVWEIRSREEEPQIRVFGQFAGKDCFVGLTWRFRFELNNDKEKWHIAMEECKSEWRKLFPAYDTLIGVSINDYISKKFYPV